MSEELAELLNILEIEQLEVDLFRGIGGGGETTVRIFGGQVIAQALAAAYGTVEGRLCHSLHAYFIRAGDPSIPVIYQVDRARDGGSFTTRRVIAVQHGKQILNMSASFHVDEGGWDHQHIPEKYRKDFLRKRPIEIREVAPQDWFEPTKASDENHLWFRVPGASGADAKMQHCLLAYASDMNLLGSSLRPHGRSFFKGQVMTASLDHAMWFHKPVNFDDWHLYSMDSPFTGGARGFNRGTIYTQSGELVASVAQEGLVRPINKDKKS